MPFAKKSVEEKELTAIMKESAVFLTAEQQKAIDRKPVDHAKIALSTKEILDRQPKVRMMLPLADGEKEGAYETVQVNGHLYTMMKGVAVDLPEAVANIIAEKYRITLTAGAERRLDNAPAELS